MSLNIPSAQYTDLINNFTISRHPDDDITLITSSTTISSKLSFNNSFLNTTTAIPNRGREEDGYSIASDWVKKYYFVVALAFGTIGNLLCLAVLSRKSFRTSPIGIYLRFLTLSDLAALYTGCLFFVAISLFDRNFRYDSVMACKFHIWLSYAACDLSAWALVLVSAARFISIQWPMKRLLTRRRAYLTLATTVAIALLVNLPMFIMYGEVDIPKGNQIIKAKCTYRTSEYKYFRDKIWNWIVLAKFALTPALLLIVLNAALVSTVVRSNNTLKGMGDGHSGEKVKSIPTMTVAKNFITRWKEKSERSKIVKKLCSCEDEYGVKVHDTPDRSKRQEVCKESNNDMTVGEETEHTTVLVLSNNIPFEGGSRARSHAESCNSESEYSDNDIQFDSSFTSLDPLQDQHDGEKEHILLEPRSYDSEYVQKGTQNNPNRDDRIRNSPVSCDDEVMNAESGLLQLSPYCACAAGDESNSDHVTSSPTNQTKLGDVIKRSSQYAKCVRFKSLSLSLSLASNDGEPDENGSVCGRKDENIECDCEGNCGKDSQPQCSNEECDGGKVKTVRCEGSVGKEGLENEKSNTDTTPPENLLKPDVLVEKTDKKVVDSETKTEFDPSKLVECCECVAKGNRRIVDSGEQNRYQIRDHSIYLDNASCSKKTDDVLWDSNIDFVDSNPGNGVNYCPAEISNDKPEQDCAKNDLDSSISNCKHISDKTSNSNRDKSCIPSNQDTQSRPSLLNISQVANKTVPSSVVDNKNFNNTKNNITSNNFNNISTKDNVNLDATESNIISSNNNNNNNNKLITKNNVNPTNDAEPSPPTSSSSLPATKTITLKAPPVQAANLASPDPDLSTSHDESTYNDDVASYDDHSTCSSGVHSTVSLRHHLHDQKNNHSNYSSTHRLSVPNNNNNISGSIVSISNCRLSSQALYPIVKPAKKNRNITRTIVIINTVFLVCNLPIVIYLTAAEYMFPSAEGFSSGRRLFEVCANGCMYTSNAINFLLYCITGSRFRRELKSMMRDFINFMCRRPRTKVNYNAASSVY